MEKVLTLIKSIELELGTKYAGRNLMFEGEVSNLSLQATFDTQSPYLKARHKPI